MFSLSIPLNFISFPKFFGHHVIRAFHDISSNAVISLWNQVNTRLQITKVWNVELNWFLWIISYSGAYYLVKFCPRLIWNVYWNWWSTYIIALKLLQPANRKYYLYPASKNDWNAPVYNLGCIPGAYLIYLAPPLCHCTPSLIRTLFLNLAG